MRHVRRPTPSRIGHRSDARDLDAGPAEQHGQGACIVSIATNVRVEVNTHLARMPAVGRRTWEDFLGRTGVIASCQLT